MARCAINKGEEAVWAWQPFGPSEDVKYAFVRLSNHYRGFPCVKVGDTAYRDIYEGAEVSFMYKGQRYFCINGHIDTVRARVDFVVPFEEVERDTRIIHEFVEYLAWLAKRNPDLELTASQVWSLYDQGVRKGVFWTEVWDDLKLPPRTDWYDERERQAHS